MATEKWIAGSSPGLTWTDVGVSTFLNSLVSGNAVICSSAIDNSSNLDMFADISISLGSITPGAGAPYLGIYLVPLNQDGTSYGDGRFGTTAAGPPPAAYFLGAIPANPSVAGVVTGMLRGVVLPPGSWKLIAHNQLGVTMASSANVMKYRTYNRAVN